MISQDDAKLIYYVLCVEHNPFWFDDKAYHDKIQHHKKKISKRYDSLKRESLSFNEASEKATTEWLTNFINTQVESATGNDLKEEEWLTIPYEQRLRITEYIFSKITEGPCSFRNLIYGRLHFNPDAYVPLYRAGGMHITNCMS